MRTKVKNSCEHYKRHIANWDRGKVSQQEYCRKAGIPLSTFQYWKSRLGKETGAFAAVEVVREPGYENQVLCSLSFKDRWRIEFGKEASPGFVKSILSACK